MTEDNNPFSQSPYNYAIKADVPAAMQYDVQNFFEEYSDVISIFEIDEQNYEILVYFNYKPDFSLIKSQLMDIFGATSFEKLNLQLNFLEDTDWVSLVQENFQPMKVGNFYIYNSFNGCPESNDKSINIKIDPGRAFGTGEHETTKLCLEGIEQQSGDFKNILDLGCGSAILAIAAQKKFPNSNVLAVDIDEVATNVSLENCKINNCSHIEVKCSENIFKESSAIFDLIISNILARPLIDLSHYIVNHTEKNGKIILSGFLDNQASEVIDVYEKLGCSLIKKFNHNKWVAILLEKL